MSFGSRRQVGGCCPDHELRQTLVKVSIFFPLNLLYTRTMTNPYYFSGVDDPYMEIWALVDSSGNILLLDQNLFILKMLESIPYTNILKIERLSTFENFSVFRKHLSNETCIKYSAKGNKFSKSSKDTTKIQEKLFELRYKFSKMLEESVTTDFYQSLFSSALLMLMFGNDESTKTIVFEEIDRFSPDIENIHKLLNEIYELR
jgi:hypothetical protein